MGIKDEKNACSVLISPLRWDSSFFNMQIGRIEVDLLSAAWIKNISTRLVDSKYELVYLFANSIDEEARKVLVDKNLQPADIKIIYQKQISEPISFDIDFIEEYSGSVSSKLLQLTYESGHKSRFRKDSILNHRFKAMYKLWIEKSVTGEMADVVLVANMNGCIGGFVTIKKDEEMGIIGLIAVDKDFRGRGIGSALLNAAENWCFKTNCKKLSVATQKENQQACRLYERNGFDEFNTQHIYHFHKALLSDNYAGN